MADKAGSKALAVVLVAALLVPALIYSADPHTLAINTDKDTYKLGEEVCITMAVLDSEGKMICNDEAVVEITTPSSSTTTLTLNS